MQDEISEEILNLKTNIKDHFTYRCNINEFLEIIKFILQKKDWDSFDQFSAQNGLFYSFIIDEASKLAGGQDIETQDTYQELKKFMTFSNSEIRDLERLNVDNVIAAIYLAIINFNK